MKDFDYSMIDLTMIDNCKMVSNLYYEECDKLLTEVLMNKPDVANVYNKLVDASKNHLYFDNFEDLKNYLEN